MESRGASPRTLTRYRGLHTGFVAKDLGKRRLSQLQPHHIRSYQQELLKDGVSPKTVTLHRALLSGALKQAVSEGMIPRNVVSLVKPPQRTGESKGKMLHPDEARALLNVVEGDRLRAFYRLLLTAGLRRGEALGVRWSDLELDGPTAVLHVNQQLQWLDGQPTPARLKSRKGRRTIPLPPSTVAALRERQAGQELERAVLGDRWSATDLVFNSGDGRPLHHNTVSQQFQRHIKSAGLGHYRLHDLRHTYGSLLMSQGVPLKTISDLLGHASIEVTANIYLHSLDVQVNDTARSVELALTAAAPAAPLCPTCGQPTGQNNAP